jgi:hypothetical protein
MTSWQGQITGLIKRTTVLVRDDISKYKLENTTLKNGNSID